MTGALEAFLKSAGGRDSFLQAKSPYTIGRHPFILLVRVLLALVAQESELYTYIFGRLSDEAGSSAFLMACEASISLLCDCGVRAAETLKSSAPWTGVEGTKQFEFFHS